MTGIENDTGNSNSQNLEWSKIGFSDTISFVTTFVISLAFYLVLAGNLSKFNIATGLFTAFVTALTLSSLEFKTSPTNVTPFRIVRFLIYLPVLAWEVTKANIRVAILILHPQMPINPQLIRIKPDFDRDLPLTVLANSITLTPGTLSVSIEGDELVIHALDDVARDDLLEGGLERWVKYVFNGRGDAK